MFVKSTRFKQVCQLLLSLIVAQSQLRTFVTVAIFSMSNENGNCVKKTNL